MAESDLNQKLNTLIEREREILKKMNVARRAGASEGVLGQLNFMLDEVRFAQHDIRQIQQQNPGKDTSGLGDYISIG